MVSSSQRPLPDNTQHSQQTNIHAPGGIRTHDLSRRAAADLHLRQRGHWDRQLTGLCPVNICYGDGKNNISIENRAVWLLEDWCLWILQYVYNTACAYYNSLQYSMRILQYVYNTACAYYNTSTIQHAHITICLQYSMRILQYVYNTACAYYNTSTIQHAHITIRLQYSIRILHFI